jgi:ABC-2 type transport system ATP-binding protein
MVYGLIGPNGAGKTSIIRVIATLLQPTYGQVQVCGIDLVADPLHALQHLGFMPDMPPLYEDLFVEEFLELFASAYGLSGAARTKRIDALLEKVQLVEKRRTPAGELSRGMKQRLFLAKTLLHDPKVLLLDEPASGLDPRARLDMRDVIVELGREGKAVVVSSHILAEMEDFCNSVGIMERGKMLLSGRIGDILKQLRPGLLLRVRLLQPDDRLGAQLGGFAGVSDVEVDGSSATFKLAGEADAAANLLRELIQRDFRVAEYRELTSNLQDIFLQVSTGRVS